MSIPGPLGRRVPSDFKHVAKYPFTAARAAAVGITVPTPVVIGVNWYSAFDAPVKGSDGRWRISTKNGLGSIRGGHCVCLLPKGITDADSWWTYYNQGAEGRCVQFGTSRAMSLLNRKRYLVSETDAGRWLYWEAQRTDEWDGGAYPGAAPVYEGTSVRAALEVVRQYGLVVVGRTAPSESEGISAYRWAQSIEDVLGALGREGAREIPFLNSWGRAYPRTTWVPTEVMARLLDEDGEMGLVTDR